MSLDPARTRQWLKDFDFKNLFIEGLGWDHVSSSLPVSFNNQKFILSAVANKRGMTAYLCNPTSDGRIPDYSVRRKIEMQVAKAVREHLIIYVDDAKTTQVWQWVKREAGKPLATREHTFHRNQTGDSLVQKLDAIAFSFSEEDVLTLIDVTTSVRAGFDVERVTKKFYERFKTEHDSFLKFLDGIPDAELERWYVSVMLNRLMFIYFVQKKSFLDNDTNYLRNRLAESKKRGKDRFYRDFLAPLFFEGFAKKKNERSRETNGLLGNVPYLDGGLFQRHQIEELHGKTIQIPDAAFQRVFDFFDQYQWHLDERPLRNDNEINPDVLGYIFEKYINQKQMGAFYTKEDITGYISQNTIIPFLFDAAKVGAQHVAPVLQSDPDRYIYDAVKQGVGLPLPKEIAAGLKDVAKRAEWNKPAPAEYALPTEIWREVVARRTRYEEVRAKMAKGEVREINDLITYNLNVRQFAQDVIMNAEGPELVRAFWHAIENISVLDPTVGSGAFLFAGLNILESLYEACLDRMHAFVEEHNREEVKQSSPSQKYSDFRKILERVSQHPNRKYFVYKSIIVSNLYGVDIMEEATEICKLRLFLKLVAQIDDAEKIEPLPDIDFNIRAGNTLVGFATYDEVKRAVTSKGAQIKMLSTEDEDTMKRIDESAEIADRAFQQFRLQQTELGGQVTATHKQELRERLKKLEKELNNYLARVYGVDPNKEHLFEKWRSSYRPFHWFIEFYGILKRGGFDVIIGNPPYVEYGKVKDEYTVRGYETESCGNLYAFVAERIQFLVSRSGLSGMIIPHSAFCTDRMEPFIKLLNDGKVFWISTYSIRPAKLFVGVDQRLAIYIQGFVKAKLIYSTTYHHWNEVFRPYLFELLRYVQTDRLVYKNSVPKISAPIESNIWEKVHQHKPLAEGLVGRSIIYFHNAPRYWLRAMTFVPYFSNERRGEQMSSHVKTLSVASKEDAAIVAAVLNSSLFFWWFLMLSNCRDLVAREIEGFPIGLDRMAESTKTALADLTSQLMADFKRNKFRKETEYQTTGKVIYDEFYPRYSKPVIDEIDRVLAKHYGFADEELDFIINYDIKYRMGREADEEE